MVSFTPSQNLICIDAKVEGYEYLCQGVLLGSEVIILDSDQDGVEKITEHLRNRIRRNPSSPIQTLHIVSHGSPGCLYLGNTQLNIDTLDLYADRLQQWRGAFAQDTEILLYGCNVGQKESLNPHPYINLTHQSAFTHASISPFIEKIQHLTGAKIAASSTKIGSKKLGGNWQLDIQTDKILSPLAFAESVRESYAGVLAILTVTNTDDAGAGSLRAAIEQANTNAEADIIEFDPTVFNTPQTINLTQELDINDNNGNNLTINGPGANNLTLNGTGDGFVFQVNTSNPETVVRISGVTVQNARTGIQYGNGEGTLEIDNSTITDNTQFGIVSRSRLVLTNSTLQNNATRGISLSGSNSIIEGNTFIASTPDAQENAIFVFTPNNANAETTINVEIRDNFIGTDANGTPELGHTNQGIEIARATGTQVIGNTISGNGNEGILVDDGSNDTVIQGNIIGVAPDGTTPLANENDGIVIRNTTGTIIGGVNPEDRNIISGNNGNGILLQTQVDAPTPTTDTQILGNYIGVDQSGNTAVPNTGQGIQVDASTLNTIGGVNPGEGNTISGNTLDGISIINAANDNTILGNFIGVNAAGDAAVPNGSHGIRIDGSTNNDIGLDRLENPDVQGTNPNVISGNGINGVLITNSSNQTKVLGNFIGTNAAGNAAIPNGEATDDPAVINGGIGVEIRDSSNNIIGRNTPGEPNTISGNLVDGIRIPATAELNSTANIIQSNLIGLDATGVAAVPNQNNGILIESSAGNTIGGSEAGQGNVISGNTINGLVLTNTANENQILGNFIGTNRAGNAAVANSNNGLELNNVVGNSVVGNLISGNGVNGVSIVNASSGNQIQGNRIGVAADGSGLGNINSGILVDNAANNIIGGREAGVGNTIAFNSGDGVTVTNNTAIRNGILGNSIFSNGAEDNTEIGIDLANDGVTINDAGDADEGPNTLQNYPELVLAEPVDNSTVVAGRYNSLPNTTYRLEFFSNDAVDPSGNGPGQTFIGTTEVTTDGEGNATFNANLPETGDLSGQFITATATDPNNNTSEFSNAVDVSLPQITIADNLALDEGDEGTVDYVYTVSLNQPTTQDIVVNYTTNDDTATVADNDYVDNDGTLTFEANPFGETPPSQQITVQANGDITFEGDEVFNVSLDSASYGNIATPSVTGTIVNDDLPPSISISDITVNEGDSTATFTVTASKISGFPTTFDYATNDITAAAGLDYEATSGSLTIPVGETTVSFDVPLIDDNLEEPDKSFGVNLTNPQGINVENSTLTATANLLDDDVSPVLNLEADNINFTEGGDAVAIANNITITDADSTALSSASIKLANPLNPGTETLSIVGTLPANITAGEYNPVSGELTLTGDASLEDYQTALSQIVYNNTSNTPNTKPRQIEVVVTDGVNSSNLAFSTVNITAVNTPPTANNDSTITRIDTPITFNITDNDFDPDGIIDPSTVELDLTGLNNQGNATVDEEGNLTFTPATGFTGSVNFPYSVQDDGGESATAQVSVTVNTSTNLPPVTQNLVTEIIPNTATQVPVPALTATDFDGAIASFQITRLPRSGQLQLNGETVTPNQTISPEDAGNLTFTPELGFVGLAEIQYIAFDDENASDLTPATVVVPVNSTNQLPVAADKIASPNPGDTTPVPVPELTAAETDGTIAGFRITNFPANSTLLLDGQPLTTPEIAVADAANLTYVGGENFTGDSFRYTATDTQGTEDLTPATVTLPASTTENLLPVTADKIGPVIPNVPAPVALPALEGTDADGNIASFTITELPVGGQLLLGGTAVEVDQVIPADQADQLSFSPDPEFSGLTQFSYAATDDQGGTDETPATYNLLVNVTNVPPVPTNPPVESQLTNLSSQVPLPPLATINNENIASFTLVELPIGGTVFFNGEPVTVDQIIPADQAGQLTFTSDIEFSGSTVLKFTATDTAGITSGQVGEISLFILPNIGPTAEPLELPGIIPSGLAVPLPPLMGSDEDGEVVSFTLQNIPAPSEGQLFIGETEVSNLSQVSEITPEQAANLRFEPSGDFVGEIVLNYVANDNDGQSSQPAPISIEVLVTTPSVDFEIPESEPIAEELIVPEIPNNGTAIEIPALTASDIGGEIVSFSLLELPLEAQGQLFLDGTVVNRLSQLTEITITEASRLTFVPAPTFLGQIQLRYIATNSVGISSSASRIVLEVPSISSNILTLPTDLPVEILAFTATLAGLSQSYSFVSESIALNAVEASIEGTEVADLLVGVEIAEQIVGLAGNDEIIAFGGNDNIFGNLDNDTINAGDGDDIAEGSLGEDFVLGGLGNDTLIGGSENDTLVGGEDSPESADTEGQDLVDGDDGNDTIFGNQAEDTLIGGEGDDLIYSGKDGDLASGEDGNDTIFGDLGNDSIVGGEGDDLLLGNEGNDTISGGEGNDFIAGGKEDDLLFGDEGDDEVYGDLGADTVYGNQGNDNLYGGEDNDTLIGGEGDDFLSGDGGNDTLSGGEGEDIFALTLDSGSDVIVDFADGQDLLGLSAGLTFEELAVEQDETATLIRFDGELLVTLNRINSTLITEEDFTTF